MKIIRPIVTTPADLVSSSIPEPSPGDGTLWNSTTAYTTGALVYWNHVRYEAVGNSTGKNPETDRSSPAVWLRLGPTNRWAMFDNVIGTESMGSSPLVVTIRAPFVGALALFELTGSSVTVTMRNGQNGPIVYQRTASLEGAQIDSFYAWFFAPPQQLRDLVFDDLPTSYSNAYITLEIEGSGQVGIGAFKPGSLIVVGETLMGANVGIIDYSAKTTDAFGRTTIVERAYSKRATFNVLTLASDFNRIYRQLAEIRATPCVYIGTDDAGFEPLIVYGFYRDFSVGVDYLTHHMCALEIEGLT